MQRDFPRYVVVMRDSQIVTRIDLDEQQIEGNDLSECDGTLVAGNLLKFHRSKRLLVFRCGDEVHEDQRWNGNVNERDDNLVDGAMTKGSNKLPVTQTVKTEVCLSFIVWNA